MKKVVVGALGSTLAISCALVVVAPSALAYPTNSWYDSSPTGVTQGYFTWYNRSVGYNGTVSDSGNPATPGGTKDVQKYWTDYDGRGTVVQTVNHTAADGAQRGYSGTADASSIPGGIRSVTIYLCVANTPIGNCDLVDTKNRIP